MNPHTFDPEDFPRGGKHSLSLDFDVPVLLVRGVQAGKTLVVTAGVHGDEYEGMRAIYDLFDHLAPGRMQGDVLMVPVANPPAFYHGTRTSPLDDANLARVFPGLLTGTPSEAIAYQLDQFILSRADFYIDLHSAGIGFLMPTMIGYDSSDARALAAAKAFGSEVLWGHPTIPPGRTVSAAKARNIPWLYTEMRGAGRIHPDDLRFLERGLGNLLRYLAILPGELEKVECRRHLYGDGNVDASITCEQRGFLIPSVDILDHVEKHQRLGRLVDLHGETLATFTAPCAGTVGLVHARPLVQPGEPLFLITQEIDPGSV